MKIGIIIGAGASAALNPEIIPVMNNFFGIVAEFAKNDEMISKTLSSLKKHNVISNETVPKGNLEDVLTQSISLPRKQKDPWERPYDGLLLTLHRIFKVLDENIEVSKYEDQLSPLIEINPEDIVFISFNYDIFLERALEILFSWNADFGYLTDTFAGYINMEQAEQAQSPEQICDEVYGWSFETPPEVSFPTERTLTFQKGNGPLVLKPHGSLNWFIHEKGENVFWMSKETNKLLLMRPIRGKVRIPRFWSYPTTNSVKGELVSSDFFIGPILPAIIPPGEKFSRIIPPFQLIEKSIIDCLSQVSILIVIGWSMRQSDRKYKDNEIGDYLTH